MEGDTNLIKVPPIYQSGWALEQNQRTKLLCTCEPVSSTVSPVLCIQRFAGECVNSGLDYWTGLLDWTTGLIFDLKFIPSAQKGKIVKEKHSVTVCVGRRESGED